VSRRIVPALVLLAACSGGPPAPAAADLVPGMVLVDFEDGTTAAQVDERERGTGVDLSFNSVEGPQSGVAIGSLGDPSDDAQQLDKLRAMPGVESVEPLTVMSAHRRVDDPDFRLQWHLQAIHAEAAWDEEDGRGVTVAVIDTGIAKVPDLERTQVAPGWNFVDDSDRALDGNGHGTHVAGTIAQSTNNALGVAGVAYGATLLPVKVLSDSGAGNVADIADGIRWAVDHGARVLNLSLGGPFPSPALHHAVQYARAHGAVVVCSAGNTGTPQVGYPAAFPEAVAVSATRFDGALAPYSSYGPEVDVAAPGGDKSVDQNGDGLPDGVLQNTIVRGDPTRSSYEWFQGTSMAAPHVAGVAALLFSAGLQTPDEVEAAIYAGADPASPPERYGHGRLDARGALDHARPIRRGAWQLAAGLAALGAALLTLPRGRRSAPLAALAGLLLGASGLFFLRTLPLGALAFLSRPVPEWPGLWLGGGRPSPFWWSAGIPLTAAFVTLRALRLREAAAGLALGFAGVLAYAALAGPPDLALVPWRTLSSVWLVLNAAVCLFVGRALLLGGSR
jgi:serine protease